MDRKGGSQANPSSVVWSVPVSADGIPDAGLHRDVIAPDAAGVGVAALAGVRKVSRLSATFDLTRQGPRVHVTGRVSARVGQNCVVTLEPIETDVDEPVDVTFAPVATGAAEPAGEQRRRTATEEPPEPLIDGSVDLGAIAIEFLILGIDPYPRKAGVEFTPPKVENDIPHPFAALEALKKSPGGGNA